MGYRDELEALRQSKRKLEEELAESRAELEQKSEELSELQRVLATDAHSKVGSLESQLDEQRVRQLLAEPPEPFRARAASSKQGRVVFTLLIVFELFLLLESPRLAMLLLAAMGVIGPLILLRGEGRCHLQADHDGISAQLRWRRRVRLSWDQIKAVAIRNGQIHFRTDAGWTRINAGLARSPERIKPQLDNWLTYHRAKRLEHDESERAANGTDA